MKVQNLISVSTSKLLLMLLFASVFLPIGKLKAENQKSMSIDSTWTLDTTIMDVKFYHKIVECDSMNTVYLRFDNQNSSDVVISWSDEFKTQFFDQQSGMAGTKEITIPAGLTQNLDCNSEDANCIIHCNQVDPSYSAIIYSYKFINPTVTKK